MTLHEQLVLIQSHGAARSHTAEFMADVILYWIEYRLGLSLYGNGWLDDDEAVMARFKDQGAEYKAFLKEALSSHNERAG